ncbi:MAG: low-complexity tail membrane protein [Microcystaceae cyanobacterium]
MRANPYLWLHFTGIAASPIFLLLTWLSLSLGDPLPFYWLELVIIGVIAILPVFLMQWLRPFYIYCLIIVSINPLNLTEEQRKILPWFKTGKQRGIALLTSIAMIGVLWLIYQYAPLADMMTRNLPQWRILGLFTAIITFSLANLFIQVPMSVLGILTSNPQILETSEPYPSERISEQFSILGLKLRQIPLMPSVSLND